MPTSMAALLPQACWLWLTLSGSMCLPRNLVVFFFTVIAQLPLPHPKAALFSPHTSIDSCASLQKLNDHDRSSSSLKKRTQICLNPPLPSSPAHQMEIKGNTCDMWYVVEVTVVKRLNDMKYDWLPRGSWSVCDELSPSVSVLFVFWQSPYNPGQNAGSAPLVYSTQTQPMNAQPQSRPVSVLST